jgi:hypothetical protein
MQHNVEALKNAGPSPPSVRQPKEKQHPGKLNALAPPTFWRILKRRAGEGVRVSHCKDPHVCPWCDNAETIEAELVAANLAAKRAPLDRDAQARLRKAHSNAAHLKRHQRALEVQRKHVDAITKHLKPDELVVQMDYVSSSSSSNRPIHDCVFAIRYKDNEAGCALTFFAANTACLL